MLEVVAMGHKKKGQSGVSLGNQVYMILTQQLHAGEGRNKHDDKLAGVTGDKIYSYSTYQKYKQHCKSYVEWIKRNHPECKTLKQAQQYVPDYLQERVAKGSIKSGDPLSAWTVKQMRSALNKLYGIKTGDEHYFAGAPKRERKNIKRSRGEAERDKHFSESKNAAFVAFCRSTGCRANVIRKLEGRDLITINEIKAELDYCKRSGMGDRGRLRALEDAVSHFSNNQYFIHHRSDKGGRERFSPIMGDVATVVDKMRSVGAHERVWATVPTKADIHSYRADYCNTVYKAAERPLATLSKRELYICRKDKAGVKRDRAAMLIASKALGHNRIDVIASNYLR